MAQLLIRQLPDEVKEGLRERARQNGRSMEAEARTILADCILPPQNVVVEYPNIADLTPDELDDYVRSLGVKLLPKRGDGPTMTFEEIQALIDEFV